MMRGPAALLGGVIVVAACGDDPTVTTGGGGAGGGGGAPQDDVWTLDNVCDLFATRWCGALEGCCTKEKFDYDEARCKERFIRESCGPMVELARQPDGHVHFLLEGKTASQAEPTISACIDSWGTHFDKCAGATLADPLALLAKHNEGICNIFVGDVDIGGPCTASAQCKKTLLPDQWADCDYSNQNGPRCYLAHVRKLGEPCVDGGYDTSCGGGLRCDAPTHLAGHCVTPPEFGTPCEPDPDSNDCGYTAYCNLDSATCTDPKKYGEACSSDSDLGYTFPAHECRSQICMFGRCQHPMSWNEDPYRRGVFFLSKAACGARAD